MDASNGRILEKPRYIKFPQLEHGTVVDGKLALNRWSTFVTKDHDFPGAQVSRTQRNDRFRAQLLRRQCFMQQVCQTERQ